MVIDESHVTIPQDGMFVGDYTRKKNLVEYGFRLPSAFDNRPLRFEEFEKFMHRNLRFCHLRGLRTSLTKGRNCRTGDLSHRFA